MKFTGNLALPLLDTPIEAACALFLISNELSAVLHHGRFFAVPIELPSNPFGGRDVIMNPAI